MIEEEITEEKESSEDMEQFNEENLDFKTEINNGEQGQMRSGEEFS